MMLNATKNGHARGRELAERLGFEIVGTEGHDVKANCIACESSDGFRVHSDTGVAYCHACKATFSRLALAERMLGDQRAAWDLLVDVGLEQPRERNGHARPSDPIEIIARQKGVTAADLVAFGARAVGANAIELPAYGPDGQQCTTFKVTINGGKGLNAKGKQAGLFFPHEGGVVRLPVAGETWYMVEGPKDAAALRGLGLLACGLPTNTMAPKFGRLFRGVHVVLVPDRDKAGVDGAEKSASVLFNVAASVRIATLPGEFKAKAGDDVRDVLKRSGGRELVLQALEDAQAWSAAETAKVAAGRRDAKELDFATEAGQFLKRSTMDGRPRLCYWRGGHLRYSDGRYAAIPTSEVRCELVQFLSPHYHKLSGRHISDTLEHVRSESMLPATIDPPAWLDSPQADWAPVDVLATKNELVHLPSLVAGKARFKLPATPQFFTTASLNYAFAEHAPEPTAWLTFLSMLWPDDPESVRTLQEWFGYCLTPDTSQQKIFLVVGPKRSGKGTIARILGAVVGEGNVAGPTFGSLATNFGLWPLLGKTVAIVSDARLGGRTDSAIVVERLLSISGEDVLTVDRKNQEPVTGKLQVRFMLLTNELPRLADASGAMASRMILLQTTESFYGREDHALTARLLRELPGILLWAIEGWRRLNERGRLVQPESSAELLDELGDLGSPVAMFVRECCQVGPAFNVERGELYEAYREWAKGQGRDHVEDDAVFGRNLKAVVPKLGKSNRRAGAHRQRFHEGIGL